MSNTVQTVVFGKSARKPFKGISMEGTINAVLPAVTFPDDSARITAKQVHVTDDMFRASCGASITPVSLANASAYALARFAYGATLDKICKGINPAIAKAMEAGAGAIKFGAGCTVGELKSAIASTFTALLALPDSKPKADKVESKPEADKVESKPEADKVESSEGQKPEGQKPIGIPSGVFKPVHIFPPAFGFKSVDLSGLAAEMALPFADRLALFTRTEAEEKAREAALRLAKVEKEAPHYVDLFRDLSANNPAQAEEMLRQMAAIMGFTLAKKRRA